MQYVGRFVSSVYNTITPNINPATLSGAIDVIVVERQVEREVEDTENGGKKKEMQTELASTPFHVRFGKMSVLRPAERKVTLHLNEEEEPLPFAMKVGEAGEAFFVEELNEDEARQGIPDDMVTSPILSASASPIPSQASEAHLAVTEHHQAPRKLIAEDYVEPLDLGTSLQTTKDDLSEEDGAGLDARIDEAQKTISRLGLDHDHPPRHQQHLDIEQDLFTRPELGSVSSAPTLPVEAQMHRRGSMGADGLETMKHEAEGSETGTVRSGETRQSDETGPTSPSLSHHDGGDETARMEIKRAATVPLTTASERPYKTYAKTLRLTSDQLKSLNLRKGVNTITFSVTSSYSGVATCAARIFLWDSAHQIVVSDIDGTITKSDALGHVYTMIGRDWTHSGVAKLYSDIVRNGYKIMYLTSRAIGQADTTRDYLRGIKQGNFRLPDGPVIMSPDRLMASLHREVILRKPEVFKMACLRDIARLFGADPRTAPVQPGNSLPVQLSDAIQPNDSSEATRIIETARANRQGLDQSAKPTPFYAGFGNRITDALSYRSVNVPSSRIFTIDHNSEVKMELLALAGYTSSYIHMTDLVDQMFPPISFRAEKGDAVKPEFNDFNFWRSELSDFDLPPDDELIYTPVPSSPVSPALSARSVRSQASIKSSASTTVLRRTSSQKTAHIGDDGSVKTMPVSGAGSGEDVAASGSRLSRFSLGKLGLSRRGSAQTVAAPSAQPDPMAHSPSAVSLVGTSPPSSPGSSYGHGVTSWTAGWRRRAASPENGGAQASSVHATSPLVGPVITAEPEEDDEDDDVSSIGEGDEDDNENDEGEEDEDEDEDGLEGEDEDRQGVKPPRRKSVSEVTRRQRRHKRSHTVDDIGSNVLDDDEDEATAYDEHGDETGVDDLLATGEIRFDWHK